MVRFAAAAFALALSLVGVCANAQQIMLLDFWSPACGPCMQMKPIVHSYEQAGYPIRQVDTTRDSQLSSQYGVSQIPCFVMLVNGQEFERKVGAMESESLQLMFERAKDEVVRRNGFRGQSLQQLPTTQSGAYSRNEAVGPANQPDAQPWPPKNSVPGERPNSEVSATAPTSMSPANAKLLAASVRLSVEDPQGRSFGTGTIIDTRSGEALVITCGHLFRESQGKAPVKADLYEVTGSGVRVVGQATGQVLSYDLKRDVALVSIRPERSVAIAAVAPPHCKLERGDRVVSIGCSNGKDPTVMESRITSLDRYQGPPNIEASGAPAIGRSGGGLFNSRGELIGICNNADPEGNEGLYASVQLIQEELDKAGLKQIYAKNDAAGLQAQSGPDASLAGGPSVVRGQELPITPLPNESAPLAAGSASNGLPAKTPGRSLSPNEQAALEEIMKRAATSEVIIIVRPKEPGGESEVIHLDNASPEFMNALRDRNSQTPQRR